MAMKRVKSFLLIGAVAILVMISLGTATAVTGLAGAAGISFPGWLMYVLEVGIWWFLFTLLFGVVFKTLRTLRWSGGT